MTNTLNNVPRELKPCPFCGSKKISYSTHQIGIAVGCDSCGAVCEIKGSKEQCAEAWNRRAPSPAGVYSADPLACSGCASGCFRCRCVTMQRAVSECGCPDCGSSLIAWPEGIDSEGGSCD